MNNIQNIKNIYAHENNQLFIKEQINIHIKEKFNINIDNIPNIDDKIQEYMYIAYKNYKKKYNHDLSNNHIETNNMNPHQIIHKLNTDALNLFINFYINDYKTKQNIFSNSEINDNYCAFTEDSFNNASTFLTNQQQQQQHHIDKIMACTFNGDSYLSERNTTISNIYSDQGFNPRELHKNMVRNYEENKKKAHNHQFNK